MYKVYIITSKNGRILYVGHTSNPQKRHAGHRAVFGNNCLMHIVFISNNKKRSLKKEKELILKYLSGGVRIKNKKQGPKSIKDKKLQLSLYIRKSAVTKAGGIKKAQEIAEAAIINS